MHGSERNQIKRQSWDWGIFFAWIVLAKGVNKNVSYVYNVDKYTYRLWSLDTMMTHDQQLNNIKKKTCNLKMQTWNTSQNTLQTSTLSFPQNNESHRLHVVLETLPCSHLQWKQYRQTAVEFPGSWQSAKRVKIPNQLNQERFTQRISASYELSWSKSKNCPSTVNHMHFNYANTDEKECFPFQETLSVGPESLHGNGKRSDSRGNLKINVSSAGCRGNIIHYIHHQPDSLTHNSHHFLSSFHFQSSSIGSPLSGWHCIATKR